MNPLPQRLLAVVRTGLMTLRLIAAFSLLTSCAGVKVTNPKNNLQLAPAPFFDAKTGIYFPGALGNLYRQPVIELEERSPGLGLAITYRDSYDRIDVFVYDLQASIIPIGIEAPVIRRNFEEAIRDLNRASKKHIYSNLQIETPSQKKLIETLFLHVNFHYDETTIKKEGQLLLAGINSQIIKIRTTRSHHSETDIDRLLYYLGRSIEQSRLNGYGGVPSSTYQNIAAQIEQIDLGDGLSESEAISIAQLEIVNQYQHNRYDVSTARLSEDDLPRSATINFMQYPTLPARVSETPLAVKVDSSGNATIEPIEP